MAIIFNQKTMKKNITLSIILLGSILLAGCSQQQTSKIPNTSITYYLFGVPESSPNFCDGENMDSAGYKAALTKKITQIVPGSLTTEEKIKTTLSLAVADSGSFSENYARTASTTFENGIITMHSADGWAGSSIFYCSWKPFVEKNLEQFPEIKEIKWVSAN